MADARSKHLRSAVAARAERELEELIAVARAEQPARLDSLGARRMVRSALATEERRARRAQHRARYVWLAAAAALVLGVIASGQRSPTTGTEVAVGEHSPALRLSLKTGDQLVLAPASQFEVLSEEPVLRRVQLSHGSALFDVKKRAKGERFEVVTPHAKVYVHGTVFTVEVRGKRSVVRVYEGSVHVVRKGDDAPRAGAAPDVLQTGEAWTSDSHASTQPSPSEKTFAAEIQSALAARATAVSPEPPPPAAPRVPPPIMDLEVPSTTEDVPTPQALTAPEVAPTPLLSSKQSSVERTSRPTSVKASEGTQPTGSSETPPPPPLEPLSAEVRASQLDRLRGLLRRGLSEEVIAEARVPAETDDAYLSLLADAQRAQRGFVQALASYERLAARASPPLRAQAGFAAAQIALFTLYDAPRALRDIAEFELEREGTPLAERASVLHVDALLRLGQGAEARELAARYLAGEPETEASARMRRILEDASVQSF